MTWLFGKFKSSEYFRNFTILSIGTVIAQAIPMIFYPILSRLFTPTDFGVLSSLATATGIIATIMTLGYQTSIIITKDKTESINVVFLTMLLSFVISSLGFIIISAVIEYIPFYSKSPVLTKYYWFSFLTAISIVLYNLFNEWSVKYKDFKRLAYNKIINSSSISLSQLLFGVLKLLSEIGLVFGDFLGRLISALSCVFVFYKKDKNSIKEVNIGKMKLMAKKYIDCPKYIMPAMLLNSLGASLPIFFIGTYFSQYELGLFAMAKMVIAIPSSIISLAMKDVFRQKASEEFEKRGNCKSLFIKTIKYLTLISILGFAFLFVIAPWIFSFVLGEQWLESGIYARYLIPMVAISFVTEVLAGIFIIAKKMKWELYWQLIYVVILTISLMISAHKNSIYFMLFAITISKSITYLLNCYLSYKFSKGNS